MVLLELNDLTQDVFYIQKSFYNISYILLYILTVAAGTQYMMVLGKQNFVSEANKFLPQTSWGMGGRCEPPLGSRGKAPGKL